MAADVTEFGVMADGRKVQKITLTKGNLTAAIITKGATLQSVRLKGVAHDLTLGSDLLSDYEGKMRHHGSLVAPVVNRFTGARAAIGGKVFQFEANQAGKHTLHCGAVGTQHKIWALAEATATSVKLTLDLAAGEGNFPGNRHVEAVFSLADANALRLDVTATTDALTLFNAANHSYWNMDGSANWAGHELRIAAFAYLPTTADFTPTGEIADVTGTAYDFRTARAITPGNPLFDNNFCLSNAAQPLRDVLWLTGVSGLQMTIATTEAGIQVYDGRNAIRSGHAAHEGLAIEAQNWPDAPNHVGFPPIELRPDQTYHQTTEWRFAQG